MSRAVRVEAASRLHLGLIDLRGDLGRRFGGLGAALAEPRLKLTVRPAAELEARGPQAERAAEFARGFLHHHGIDGGVGIEVEEAIPPHVGLGSGTQLALAVARALAELFDVSRQPHELARAVDRARRSGVGTWLFDRGGFVVEGGRTDRGRETPLLFQHAVPAGWRCVVAIPAVPRGLSGAAEEAAFRELAPPSADTVGRISHLILLGALPALLEEDLPTFGRAITRIQRLVGDCFADVQGGRFAHPRVESLIEQLSRAGAPGVGQSSWGPAVFALSADPEEAAEIADLARREVGEAGRVYVTAFENSGARLLESV